MKQAEQITVEQTTNEEPERGLVPLGDILGNLFSPEMLSDVDSAPKEASTRKQRATTGSRSNAKLAAAAAEIAARPDATEAAYLARQLVQCTLPHRDPGSVTVWLRKNGGYSLGLQPGVDLKTGKSLGLPYGPLPRLLLLWIVTEAIRTKSRRIRLSASLNEFLRALGLDPKTGRGPRGDATRLKEQMKRLFNCRISFQYQEGDPKKGRETRLNMEVANKIQYWWDFNNPDQGGLFESEIVLGEGFFEAITAAPVPLDMRALLPLKKSPLAIDLYTWTTYRLFTMQRAGSRQAKIPLADLQSQFGSEYSRLRDFKAAFSEALAKVQEVFPALDYTFEKDALILRDSRQRPSVAPIDKTAARRRLNEMKPFDQISEKARDRFKQDYPRWDVDAVIAEFYAWREEKGEQSGNTDAHFRAFSKTWVQRNS